MKHWTASKSKGARKAMFKSVTPMYTYSPMRSLTRSAVPKSIPPGLYAGIATPGAFYIVVFLLGRRPRLYSHVEAQVDTARDGGGIPAFFLAPLVEDLGLGGEHLGGDVGGIPAIGVLSGNAQGTFFSEAADPESGLRPGWGGGRGRRYRRSSACRGRLWTRCGAWSE